MQFKTGRRALTAAVGVFSLLNSAAHAQGIEEIIVTAEKREENLQNTPIAITALSADALQERGITGFEGVAKSSPSISFTPYPSSTNMLIMFMRGQGVLDPMQITSDGSIGMYVDGFYISRPQASTFDLADVERVEVLRGPQGTLYGRNTTGGAVNMIGKKPTGEFGLKQDFSFGTRNFFRSLTTVDFPKFADISTKLTLLKSSRDGYVKNTGSSHDFGEEERRAGKFSLQWDRFDQLTVELFLEIGDLDSTPIYYQNQVLSGRTVQVPVGMTVANNYPYYANGGHPQSKTYRPFDLRQSTSRSEGSGLTVTWDVNDTLTLKSLTGYRTLDWFSYQDLAEALMSSFSSANEVNSHQFSQEFQISGSALDDSIQYVGGLYYFKEGASHNQNSRVGAVVIPSSLYFVSNSSRYVTADAESQAVYGQVTWTPDILDGDLGLTFGARYTKDKREATRDFYTANSFGAVVAEFGAHNNQSFSRFNPSFTANYTFSDALNIYAKVTTGYKAGGSSSSAVPPFGDFKETFKPEEVTTYEFGMKSYWLDRRIRINAAAFESRFEDMQLAIIVDPTNSGVVQTFNAGEATVKGVELELLYQPVDVLTLRMDYAWLQAKFDSVEAPNRSVFDRNINTASPYGAGDEIKDLFVMPYAPKHTVNVGVDYTFYQFTTGDIALHLDYRYQSSLYGSASAGRNVPGRDNLVIPGYGILDGRITFTTDLPRGDQMKVSLWARNLANKQYAKHIIGNGGPIEVVSPVTGAVTSAGFTSQGVVWSEPPSYGVDIAYRY